MRSCLSGKALRFCYESRVLPHDPPFSTTELETIGADRQPIAPKQQLTGCLLRPQAGLFTIEAQVSGAVVGGDDSRDRKPNLNQPGAAGAYEFFTSI